MDVAAASPPPWSRTLTHGHGPGSRCQEEHRCRREDLRAAGSTVRAARVAARQQHHLSYVIASCHIPPLSGRRANSVAAELVAATPPRMAGALLLQLFGLTAVKSTFQESLQEEREGKTSRQAFAFYLEEKSRAFVHQFEDWSRLRDRGPRLFCLSRGRPSTSYYGTYTTLEDALSGRDSTRRRSRSPVALCGPPSTEPLSPGAASRTGVFHGFHCRPLGPLLLEGRPQGPRQRILHFIISAAC